MTINMFLAQRQENIYYFIALIKKKHNLVIENQTNLANHIKKKQILISL
jgi:hypothetical protein